jgi:hypothetical protein
MAPVDEPSGIDMTDNDSQQDSSTKSTEGRKLRQILQKKQLDVLLQTYSSYIDEAEEPRRADPDFYSISRKKSIEGNPKVIDLVDETDNSSVERRYRRNPTTDIGKMRRNGSLISVDDEQTSVGGRIRAIPVATSDDEDVLSDDAVADDAKSSHARKGKKKMMTRRKKRGELTTRMLLATDVVTGFGSRCTQKHLEIADDLKQVTTELRYHLKSGANIVFEDLADHFDGIVENLFVSDERDDGADRQQRRRQQAASSSSRRQQSSQRDDDFSVRPLTHDETIMEMNRQVSQLLEPMAALTGKMQEISCIPHEGHDYHDENLRVNTTASF